MIDVTEARAILARTPAVVGSLLDQLGTEWTEFSPDAEVWNAREIVTHLIEGEITDWIPRAKIILEHGPSHPFEPFDRSGGRDEVQSLPEALERLSELRTANLQALDDLGLTSGSLEATGTHPELGSVTLSELLATWAAHDLGHIGQIVEVLAKRYAAEVGPWSVYLPILTRPPEPSG